MEEPNPASKLDLKKILPIFIIVLVDLLGLTIIIPLLPLYATSFGADPFTIGLLAASYPALQFIGAPLLGRLSDRYGRKPVLVISQLGTFAGFVLLGLANSLWLLFISRLLDGISGANIATAQAAISDSTTEETRTQGLGLIGAAFGLGFIIGPVIAFVSLALTDNNYHVPAFVAAGFSLLSIFLTTFWFEETLPAAARGSVKKEGILSLKRMATAAAHPAVGILFLLVFAQQLAFGGFEQLFSLFTLNRLGLNASGNAIVFVFAGLIFVAVQGYFIGRWSRTYGDRRLIYGGLGLLAAGLLLTAFTPRQAVPWYDRQELEEELTEQRRAPAEVGETTPDTEISISLPQQDSSGWAGLAWLLVSMVPVSVGGGILHPSLNSLITKRVAVQDIGEMLGISSAFYSAANALAPLLGGALFDALGAQAPFIAWGILLAFLLGVALRLIRPGREEKLAPGLARGSSAGD